mmetsp:Transcript_74037/g.176241  ORF Transcript_74037/g.176241 Transcript_74037/m.176241 type:complete len:279 (+) Transcript_74037:3173-4009(+)
MVTPAARPKPKPRQQQQRTAAAMETRLLLMSLEKSQPRLPQLMASSNRKQAPNRRQLPARSQKCPQRSRPQEMGRVSSSTRRRWQLRLWSLRPKRRSSRSSSKNSTNSSRKRSRLQQRSCQLPPQMGRRRRIVPWLLQSLRRSLSRTSKGPHSLRRSSKAAAGTKKQLPLPLRRQQLRQRRRRRSRRRTRWKLKQSHQQQKQPQLKEQRRRAERLLQSSKMERKRRRKSRFQRSLRLQRLKPSQGLHGQCHSRQQLWKGLPPATHKHGSPPTVQFASA